MNIFDWLKIIWIYYRFTLFTVFHSIFIDLYAIISISLRWTGFINLSTYLYNFMILLDLFSSKIMNICRWKSNNNQSINQSINSIPTQSIYEQEECNSTLLWVTFWKERINSDGQQFHQYQQNGQPPLTSDWINW
jgi:hypothetical protein